MRTAGSQTGEFLDFLKQSHYGSAFIRRSRRKLMARVTVEDCLNNVENRFSLVHLAATRTKQLYRGSRPLIQCKNREAVIALREIADNKVRPASAEDTEAQ